MEDFIFRILLDSAALQSREGRGLFISFLNAVCEDLVSEDSNSFNFFIRERLNEDEKEEFRAILLTIIQNILSLKRDNNITLFSDSQDNRVGILLSKEHKRILNLFREEKL